MSFRIIAKQRDQLEKIHGEIIAGIDDDIEELLDQLDKDIVYEARSNLQNNESINTGDLHASVKVLSVDRINHVHEVGSDSDHAAYVEYGRPEIRPRNPDGVLHWEDKNTGEDVFSKYSGPTEPRPFLAPAVLSKTAQFKDVIVTKQQQKINRIVKS